MEYKWRDRLIEEMAVKRGFEITKTPWGAASPAKQAAGSSGECPKTGKPTLYWIPFWDLTAPLWFQYPPGRFRDWPRRKEDATDDEKELFRWGTEASKPSTHMECTHLCTAHGTWQPIWYGIYAAIVKSNLCEGQDGKGKAGVE